MRAKAPKLFTPLAAAYIGPSTRYLFFVDDANILRGVKTTSNGWQEETGLAQLNVSCAHYSQLTAITIFENNFQAICLYYQMNERTAGITMLSYSTKTNAWVRGVPDMTPRPPPPPPPPIRDPPLHGTSITAVRTRPGLEIIKGSKMPMVYLQWDTLALAHAQEAKVGPIGSLDLKFAPHTSLTTVDDGKNLYCFYTSSNTNNIKVIVIGGGVASNPRIVATPTPRSAIAAVLPTPTTIVLFYQALNREEGVVELRGGAFPKDAAENSLTQVDWVALA